MTKRNGVLYRSVASSWWLVVTLVAGLLVTVPSAKAQRAEPGVRMVRAPALREYLSPTATLGRHELFAANSNGDGAIWGALVGGLVGAFVIGKYAGGQCERPNCDAGLKGAVIGGAVGAGVGALAGWLVSRR